VIIVSEGNSTITDPVTFSQITISKQPVSVAEEEGKPVSISVRASGSGLKYQWYIRSSDDRTYTKSAITSSSYSCTMTAAKNGRQLYCVITDSYGNSVKTDQVSMNLATYAAITEQPSDATAGSGKKVSTTVTAIGDGLNYQWYVKNPGTDRFIKSSVTGKTYSYTMSSDKSGRKVYCIVKDQYGTSVKSNTVTFSLLAITEQPSSTSVDSGETITVSCAAEGKGVTYQWYVKNPGGSAFSKSSVTGSTYSYRMTADKSGRQVYCVATDSYGNSVKTKTVTLKMRIHANILTQPKSVRVLSGEKAAVSVKAEGDGLTYEWYVASAGVKKYTKSSVTKSSYSITMSEEKSGRKAYCIITDKYGTSVRTKTVTLNMAVPLQIVTDLLPTYAYPGEEASMTVEATGQGELHYTWYTRKSSKDEWEKTSVEGNTYSIVMNEELSGMSVYCVITDNYGQRATTWSRAFTMIRELTITQQLEDVRASYNDGTALFWVRVEGTSYNLLEYEWYYTRPKDGGVYSKRYTGSKPSIEFDAVPANKGLSVYCVISDPFGQSVTSEEAYLYLYN